jgi:predicted ATPase
VQPADAAAAAEVTAAHDVFISYSSHDRDRADAACDVLERNGLRCWIAPRDGSPGVDYASFLVEAIERSRIVVLIFSRAANDSDAVLNELELAANRGIPVLPLRIEDAEPHGAAEFYLRRRHWLDAHADFDRALEALAPAVRAALAQRVAVRSTAPRTHQRNLPRQTTTFVGRERDLAGVAELIGHGPLLTIVGPGGVGKTRLALQSAIEFDVANEHVDEAWFVDLAPLAGDGLVAGTILTAIGASAGGREPLEALVEHLRDRRALLVIDNCEHVVAETGSVVSAIVSACGDVTIVATSREALNITGERVYRLHPLEVATAVGLFVERARAVNPLFELTPQNVPIVEQICARLDGLPLAIELAAARVRVIAVDELSRRLSERFRLLTGGSRSALPHQQTMRALIDWSYDTLSDEERALLRRMAAFAGSFSLEAVSDVAAFDPLDGWEVLDRLASLVDKSLVTADVDDRGQRYYMLQSIHDYADERLAQSGERDTTAQRHAIFFAAFAHASYDEWDTAPASDWLARTRAELDNLRAALTWTLTQDGDHCVGAQLAADTVPLFLRSSLLGEGLRWCEIALAVPEIDMGTSAQLHYGLSMLYNNRNAIATALAHVETAVVQFRAAGSKRRLTRALSQQAQQTARLGRHADAMNAAAEAIDAARRSSDLRLLAATLQRCALVFPPDQIERARAQFDESVRLFRGLGRDDETARALEWWATAEGNAECFERAIELAHEAAAHAVDDGDRLHRHNIVAACALAIGDRERAAPAVRATLALAHAGNHPTFFAYATSYIAALCGDDDAELAARLVGFSETRFAALGAELDITDTLRSDRLAAMLRSRLGDELLAELRAEGALWDDQRAFTQASRI